jgi:hypothetical protein
VADGRGGADLAQEAPSILLLAALEELQRDRLIGGEVGRLPHPAHSALTQKATQAIRIADEIAGL